MHCNSRLNEAIFRCESLKRLFSELTSDITFPGGEKHGVSLRHAWGLPDEGDNSSFPIATLSNAFTSACSSTANLGYALSMIGVDVRSGLDLSPGSICNRLQK
jgi:hypothetical protein